MFRVLSFVAAVAVALSMLLALSQPAAAHERRNLGPYQLVVGWLNEPAFVGETNAVDITVTDTRVTPAKPIEGLEKTLKVEILAGGLTAGYKADFRTRFGLPGKYAADIIPTKAGAYKFKVTGKIESLDVNEIFESGPGRFGDIETVTALQYPQAVPAGADLSTKLGDLQSAVDQTRIAALAAVVLSVVGIALALRTKKA
ncbi:MAG: hypothetical protein EXR61_02285 [Chloroflexi bacterium]|nr:hypothetical protein [Chloroflexota bacterium]